MRDARRGLALGLILSSGVAVGCGEAPGPDEPIEAAQGALSSTTFADDAEAPVHVQVKVCTSDPAEHPSIDCTVDFNYALIGGGAWAQYTGNGAMLTESYPKTDGRTWH